MAKRVKLNEALFDELRLFFEQDRFTTWIHLCTHLRDKSVPILNDEEIEQIVVFGRLPGGIKYPLIEDYFGCLIALAEGLVLCQRPNGEVLGCLERVNEFGILYRARPFNLDPTYRLNFWAPVPDDENRPFVVLCEITGERMSESHSMLSIMPERWTFMEQWLRRWLPETN